MGYRRVVLFGLSVVFGLRRLYLSCILKLCYLIGLIIVFGLRLGRCRNCIYVFFIVMWYCCGIMRLVDCFRKGVYLFSIVEFVWGVEYGVGVYYLCVVGLYIWYIGNKKRFGILV